MSVPVPRGGKSPSLATNPFAHPLCGADLLTLARLVGRYGWPSRKRLPHLAAAVVSAVGRLPFTLTEGVYSAWLRPEAAMPAPVFVIGHWRSGTTHFYNLLACGRQVSYVTPLGTGLPWELLTLVPLARRWLEGTIPEDRLVDRIPVTPTAPQEDEMALSSMATLSFLHGLYFPRHLHRAFLQGMFLEGTANDQRIWERRCRRFLGKVWRSGGGGRLVVKNPGHTVRIATLKALWPEAQFIHVVRDPHALLPSMRNMITTLLPALAWQDPRVSGSEIDGLIFETYDRMMAALVADSRTLEPHQFAEVRYEALVADPINCLRDLYRHFQWPGWEEDCGRVEVYLASIRGYEKNHFPADPAVGRDVVQHWGHWLDHWGYR
ncbi:MAG: sulfotransferase [Candidatus Competibacterales bacterium]